MKKNNILLLIIAFSLAIVATLLYLNRSSSTLNNEDAVFKVDKTSPISKIAVYKNGQEVFYLKCKEDSWLYSDKFSVDKTLMKFMYQVVSCMEVSSLVSENISHAVSDSLEKAGHEITITDINGNSVKDYFIWVNNHTHATYAKMKGSSQPYLVKLPGYQGNFAGVFSITAEEWYNKSLITILPKDIKAISFENLSNRALSFTLDFSGKKPVLINAKGQEIQYKKEAMQVYLTFLLKERYDMVSFNKNSKLEKPLYSIKIKTRNLEELTITFFQLKNNNGTQANTSLALINDTTIASINSNNLDLIFRDISFFSK